MKKHFQKLMASSSSLPSGDQNNPDFECADHLQQDSSVLKATENPIFGSSSSSSSQPLSPPPPPPPPQTPIFIFGKNTPPLIEPQSQDPPFIFGQNSKLENDESKKKCEEKDIVDDEKKESKMEEEPNKNEEEKKRWNFRPRKPIQQPHRFQSVGVGSSSNKATPNVQPERKNEERRKKNTNANVPIMPTFSPTLTKDEIREDFIKMTGKPPPSRPKTKKKVKKEVQENLDRLHIGALLSAVTLKDYGP